MTSQDALRTSYDELPYPSLPIRATHPSVLAAAGAMHGLTTASPGRCRVLELGCAGGGNLVPMAASLPDASFVGVDLSPRHIGVAAALAAEVGVANIRWHALDLQAIGRELGEFDYIICHGVYSWVPAEVQQQILALCRRQLAPGGIAYISYNTYPGFYARQLVRDMMRYHTRGTPAGQRVAEARRLLAVMIASQSDPTGSYASLLRDEADKLAGSPDGYIGHEHLEVDNRPCYFHEFMAAAGAHGLAFVCEAERLGTFADLPPGYQALAGSSVIEREQYLDFLLARSFRATLLSHAGERPVRPDAVRELWALATALPDGEGPAGEARFRTAAGEVSVSDPVVKGLLSELAGHHPCAVAVRDLPADRLDALAHAWAAGLCELHAHLPRVVAAVSPRPLASPIVRALAGRQTGVPNQWHQLIELDPLERGLVALLDGGYDHGARAGLSAELDAALARLAANALLCA